MSKLPLARFKVVDLTRVRAGPTCVRQLADWGADCIKVEAPDADGFTAERHGPDFQNLHRNKRSITLDLKQAAGVAVLKRLVAEADVLVENYRPDVKFRLGIDYESLKPVNSRLVYASISGFGQDGPYRDRPGFDQIAQGMGGLMSITAFPARARCAQESRSPISAPAFSRHRAF
jgi:crotonobetainyl-CoA:carnitine CoA-transferase CaiB-like acyl-CoA transferase